MPVVFGIVKGMMFFVRRSPRSPRSVHIPAAALDDGVFVLLLLLLRRLPSLLLPHNDIQGAPADADGVAPKRRPLPAANLLAAARHDACWGSPSMASKSLKRHRWL